MVEHRHIVPPAGGDDIEGARRVFGEFFILYQPVLSGVEHHLERVIIETDPHFTDAYRPWHKALQELLRGAYLMARKIPLPDPEGFLDAVRMFSFEGAIQLLADLCVSCRIALPRDWEKKFQEHIHTLLFSLSILNRQAQPSMMR